MLFSKIPADGDWSHEIKRCLLLLRKAMTNLDSILKADITLLTNVGLVKTMVFPVVMYGCESWTVKKTWAPKNWCFWTVVLEKNLESPLYSKEIQSVYPKRIQSFWIFIGRTDTEAPILWPPDVKNWLIGKDPDVGKNWRQGENGTTENEMVRSHWWIWVWANSGSWWWNSREALHSAVHVVTKNQTQLNFWTEMLGYCAFLFRSYSLSIVYAYRLITWISCKICSLEN